MSRKYVHPTITSTTVKYNTQLLDQLCRSITQSVDFLRKQIDNDKKLLKTLRPVFKQSEFLEPIFLERYPEKIREPINHETLEMRMMERFEYIRIH